MRRAPWLITLLLLATPASAQELNRQAFPVGEEAVGMAGAYTGRADDASAAYYNPGGLAIGHRGSVGVSLSLSILDSYRVGPFAPDSTALEYRNALGVPFYAGGSVQVGPQDGTRHGLAFATFSPNNVNRRYLASSSEMGETRSLQIHRTDRTRWYGVSYAIRPIPELGIGVSGFAAVRQFRHEEEEIAAAGADSLYTRISQIDLNAELLIFRIGALWQLDPTFSLGLMVQPPAIVLGGRATVSGTASGATPAGIETSYLADDIGADSPLPFQARLGASWHPDPAFMLNLDLIVEGPVGSEANPIERIRLDPAEPQILGAFLATRYHSDWIADFAVGGQGVIEGLVPVSAGVFSSFSSAPPLPDAPTAYRPDRVHMIGAALGVGVITGDIDFTIGVVGAFGFGRGITAAPFQDLAAPTYGVQDVSSQSVFLYLVGAGGAAAAVGRQVAEEILGVGTDDDDAEEETDADAGADTEPEPEPDPEPEPEPEPDLEPDPEPDADPETDAEDPIVPPTDPAVVDPPTAPEPDPL